MKKVHYYSGLFISVFIVLHFGNHLFALVSPEKHIETMELVRLIYRHPIFEVLLVGACLTQIIAGISLYRNKKKSLQNGFDKIHLYSGLYLAFFLMVHPIAIFVGRYYLEVDTNFWYGAMGVNHFPELLFFIPYYFLGVFSFFAHVACIHRQKVMALGWNVSGDQHAQLIMLVGGIIGLLILTGFTGFFQGLPIPDEYLELLG